MLGNLFRGLGGFNGSSFGSNYNQNFRSSAGAQAGPVPGQGSQGGGAFGNFESFEEFASLVREQMMATAEAEEENIRPTD